MTTDRLARERGTGLGDVPGTAVLKAIRRLMIWALVAGGVYGLFAVASKGVCPRGVTSDGGYLDSNGLATDAVPQCLTLSLGPSPLVFVALIAVVLWALSALIRRPGDESAMLRILSRARLAVVVIVVGSFVIAFVGFALIPISEWDGSGDFVVPFPFGVVDVAIRPMGG